MSFGALSSHAVLAMNKGAAMGGFAQDTGEGGLTPYHLKHGADVIWEIGSGYFGCRTKEGRFDDEDFREQGVEPAGADDRDQAVAGCQARATAACCPASQGQRRDRTHPRGARRRGLPVARVASGVRHAARPARVRGAGCAGCAVASRSASSCASGRRSEFLGICKAMLDTGILPDFITVDGAEGGTGAAPVELSDKLGLMHQRGAAVRAQRAGRLRPARARSA